MITAIGLYLAACVQTPPTYLGLPLTGKAKEFYELYDVDKMPNAEERMKTLMQQAMDREFSAPIPYIPNGFQKDDPVPYMPGAGEPLINREIPAAKHDLVAIPAKK